MLHKIIATGLALNNVVVSGIVSYGAAAAGLFAAVESTYTEQGRKVLKDETYRCMLPPLGEHPPHGRYIREKFVKTAVAVASAFASCFSPLAVRLGLDCPEVDDFEEIIYTALRSLRLGQLGASELDIPEFGDVLDAPAMNPMHHSADEFEACAYVLHLLKLPSAAEDIIAAIELGGQYGRADIAVRFADGTLLLIEYDGGYWHRASRLEGDVRKTERLLAFVDEEERPPIVVRLREGGAAEMPAVLGAHIVLVPAGRTPLGPRVVSVLSPLLARLSPMLVARLAEYTEPSSQLDVAHTDAWALVDINQEKSAEMRARLLAYNKRREAAAEAAEATLERAAEVASAALSEAVAAIEAARRAVAARSEAPRGEFDGAPLSFARRPGGHPHQGPHAACSSACRGTAEPMEVDMPRVELAEAGAEAGAEAEAEAETEALRVAEAVLLPAQQEAARAQAAVEVAVRSRVQKQSLCPHGRQPKGCSCRHSADLAASSGDTLLAVGTLQELARLLGVKLGLDVQYGQRATRLIAAIATCGKPLAQEEGRSPRATWQQLAAGAGNLPLVAAWRAAAFTSSSCRSLPLSQLAEAAAALLDDGSLPADVPRLVAAPTRLARVGRSLVWTAFDRESDRCILPHPTRPGELCGSPPLPGSGAAAPVSHHVHSPAHSPSAPSAPRPPHRTLRTAPSAPDRSETSCQARAAISGTSSASTARSGSRSSRLHPRQRQRQRQRQRPRQSQ